MKSPKVSVIMPSYNSAQYIAEAIESILNQTFTDFEFIIINDGSTDDTAKIIKEYANKDHRIKFINHKKNKGFIGCLNECLDIASGEYIAKMDSDDISLPQRLEKQVKYLDEHPSVGMVGCGYRAFDHADFEYINPAYVGYIDLIKGCATTVVLFRKSIIDAFNLRFNPDFYCAEDYDFYSRFIRYADIHNLQEVLYLYRWHGENTSIKKNKIQQDNSDIVRQNILDIMSANTMVQKYVLNVSKGKTGFLLPKFLGRIVCLFIFSRDTRHHFRDKYVKD